MTSHIQTAATASLSHADRSVDLPGEDKWPIPYAAMFLVVTSIVLWYGIYLAGSSIIGLFG